MNEHGENPERYGGAFSTFFAAQKVWQGVPGTRNFGDYQVGR
jgi:hypothetical protein